MSDKIDPRLAPDEVLRLSRQREITSQVKTFYEKIQFPGRRPLEQDSLIFLRKFSILISELSEKNQTIRVLDAGCGTGNTSLSLAAQFRHVTFVGLDLSATSIKRAQGSAREKKLSNVSFAEWNLLKPLTNKSPFHIILCFGVLHHTASVLNVLQNLSKVLDEDGTLFLWVYGKYGRYRHTLNMQLLSLLISESDGDEQTIDLAREFIEKTDKGQVVKDLLGNRSDDQYLTVFKTDPTWIADQFLNPNEQLLTLKQLRRLFKQSGFQISEWIGVPKDLSKIFDSKILVERFNRLSSEKQLIALDLLLKMERYFLVLEKPDKSEKK